MSDNDTGLTPKFAPFIGMGGVAGAMIFGCLGAAYGTAKSGIGIAGVGTFRPDLIMKVRPVQASRSDTNNQLMMHARPNSA